MSDQTSTALSSSSSSLPMIPTSTTFPFGKNHTSEAPFTFEARPSLSQTPSASSSTTSGTPRFTPSPTPASSSVERASASPLELRSRSMSAWSVSSNTTSEAPRFTPTSTVCSSSEAYATSQLFTPSEEVDPDNPLPSIERDHSSTGSRQSISSIVQHTPFTTAQGDSVSQSSEQHDLPRYLQKMMLESPGASIDPPSQRNTPTPSIHITSAPSTGRSDQSRACRTDSLSGGIVALRMDSTPGASSYNASEMCDNRSASPSRRRRSRSTFIKELHRPENENPPRSMFHTIQIQEALAESKRMVAKMESTLSSYNLHQESGSSIERLHQQAMRLSAFRLHSSRTVGLVGDSGAGKSSLINSLLHETGLARASSSGAACTCVVTEYHYHDRTDYIIHVDYFSIEELRTQYEELLQAYRDNSQEDRPTSRANIARDAQEERDDRDDLQKTADLAAQTFNASFRERLDQTPTLLSSMPFDSAVETMVEWASQILPPQNQELFNSKTSCSARLRDLTSDTDLSRSRGVDGTSLWPFVRKLRVYLNAYILSKGLVIADLPGLRDSNSARRNVTERYIRECHQILVVARIERAMTDQSIKDIFELARRASLANISVVCTRSDDIETSQARNDWPFERATIDAMQRRVDDDTREIESLTEEIEDFELDFVEHSLDDAREYKELQQARSKAQRSKEKTQFELLRHIVTVRNNNVIDSVYQEYRDHPAAAALRIFCISNQMYSSHRDNHACHALPHLQLSGILEVRRYCIGIIAESHLRATLEYIKDEIPAFLGSIELWIEAGSGNASAERKQQIQDVASGIQRELDKLISPDSQVNHISRTLRTNFKTQMHLHMRNRGPQWTVESTRASGQWLGWHHTSFSAFCRNYGDHCTKAIGSRCWNEEAMVGMVDDLTAIWDSFKRDLDGQLDHTQDTLERAFGIILGVTLSAAHIDTQSTLRPLTTTIRHRQDLSIHGFDKAVEDFNSRLSALRTDAFSSIRTAFVGRLMEHAYHNASMEFGDGSHQRRKCLISGRFASPTFWDEYRREFKDSFRDKANRLESEISEIVCEQVTLIERDLQMLRTENEVSESERNPEFRNRVRQEVERVKAKLNAANRTIEELNTVN